MTLQSNASQYFFHIATLNRLTDNQDEPVRQDRIKTLNSDCFYPDFLVKMENGPLVAIEYKGAHIANNRDWQAVKDGVR